MNAAISFPCGKWNIPDKASTRSKIGKARLASTEGVPLESLFCRSNIPSSSPLSPPRPLQLLPARQMEQSGWSLGHHPAVCILHFPTKLHPSEVHTFHH